MNDLDRLKVLLYQYILFKGAYYEENYKCSLDKFKRTKEPDNELYIKLINDYISNRVFDDLFEDINTLLSTF